MTLKLIKGPEMGAAAKLLARYWKGRGMEDFDESWAKDYLTKGHSKEIKEDDFFVCHEDDSVVGIVSLVVYEGDVAEIRDLVVSETERGKGLGGKIVQSIIEKAKELGLRKIYALACPLREKLFASAGFEKEGVLKNHYKDGEDLTIMSKFL